MEEMYGGGGTHKKSVTIGISRHLHDKAASANQSIFSYLLHLAVGVNYAPSKPEVKNYTLSSFLT